MRNQSIEEIQKKLKKHADIPKENHSRFFKTGKGEYAEGDQFIGVKVPTLRMIAKGYYGLSLKEVKKLIQSPINEERFFALIILVHQYKTEPENVFQFYLTHLKWVNNWNLVDASAHLIVGAHLFDQKRDLLLTLAKSDDLWERRVAIVATWYFIRQGDLDWTFRLSKMLLNDEHDLMHKAVGWMLREAGKKDASQLVGFLDQHSQKMPRTMLRYAIERFPEKKRKRYLAMKKD